MEGVTRIPDMQLAFVVAGFYGFSWHLVFIMSGLLHGDVLGCSRKNPHPPDGWDSGNSRGRGGRRLRKSRREGGLTLKKSSAGVISTDS